MTYSKKTRLVLLAAASLLLSLGATALAADGPDACEATAMAVRKSAEREGNADFWIAVGNCLNESDGNIRECIREAHVELEEAMALAEEQYEARLVVCELVGDGPYDPEIDPTEFSAMVDNTYFPLVPGRTLVYRTVTPEGIEWNTVTTLEETVEIEGVECRAVHDVVSVEGERIEDTIDWFSEHAKGAAWYMGEISKNFEDGFLDNLDGSWRFGKDGAKPGIIMPANPEPHHAYRQEFLLNEAEDVARVVSLGETVTVHYGTFQNCVVTLEGTPIEPGLFERKVFAPGVGFVLGVDLESGERTELWAIND